VAIALNALVFPLKNISKAMKGNKVEFGMIRVVEALEYSD
jgi:hypothetical protein